MSYEAGPPDSPPEEKEIPTRDCPECHRPMAYVQERRGWVCDDGCDGYIEDEPYEPSYDEICREDR